MLNKILVAVDGSTMNRKVFEVGMSLAQTTGASLMLLHVLSSDFEDYPTPFIDSELADALMYKSLLETYQEHWQKFEEQGRELLQSLTEEAIQAGINTEYTQTWDNPGRKICDLAQTWSAELILVGSRGLTGVKEIFLGSVSNMVTNQPTESSPCF